MSRDFASDEAISEIVGLNSGQHESIDQIRIGEKMKYLGLALQLDNGLYRLNSGSHVLQTCFNSKRKRGKKKYKKKIKIRMMAELKGPLN
jgi:hypothetical protein